MQWAHKKAITVLALVATALLFQENLKAPTIHLDFAPIYGSALLSLEGNLAQAYETDNEVLKRANAQLCSSLKARGYPLPTCLRYLYPPVVSLLFVPFTLFDYPVASYLFRSLSLLMLAVASFFVARALGRGFSYVPICFLGIYLLDATRMTIDLGQTNLLVLAFLSISCFASSALVSGLFLSLACIFKTFCFPALFLLFLASKHGRTIGLWCLFFLTLANALVLVLNEEAVFSYLDMLSSLSSYQFIWPEQQSLGALIKRIQDGMDAGSVVLWQENIVPAGMANILGSIIGAVLFIVFAVITVSKKPSVSEVFAVSLPLGLFISPIMHSHYGVVLALPCAIILGRNKMDMAFYLTLAGLSLQVIGMHQDEAKSFAQFLKSSGLGWFFVSYRLLSAFLLLVASSLCLFVSKRNNKDWALKEG
jgi:hypothetical protein